MRPLKHILDGFCVCRKPSTNSVRHPVDGTSNPAEKIGKIPGHQKHPDPLEEPDRATLGCEPFRGLAHQPDFRRSNGPCFSVGTQQRGNAYPLIASPPLGRLRPAWSETGPCPLAARSRRADQGAFLWRGHWLSPERTRFRISSRSNSVTADRRCAIMRPMGVLMSI